MGGSDCRFGFGSDRMGVALFCLPRNSVRFVECSSPHSIGTIRGFFVYWQPSVVGGINKR
jgi:hypothetical protein